MREVLIAYHQATQSIIDLFSTEERFIDHDRLEQLLAERDILIARQPALPNLQDDAELRALAEEIVRLDATARDLVQKGMSESQQGIQKMNTQSRRVAAYEQAYEQAYSPDAFFIDKKK